jgi:hypothetical protein
MAVCLLLGATGVLFGAAAAVGAPWFPAHKARLEQWGGALFICGLILAGLGLPMI